ncbi:hypothetical protein PpBr36_02046 [Pyricularia pennisetigena]|uniref:hypothetical protein n=1 Tax=Pyricularia pennisetigena TaxID=1578925 RepID=UPI00114F1E9A|nr:hypothetical protein PpBr36_02046 [Pyricularia pennisetigena]TLS27820.1 hypothetical protein PpBr36_02046 [Pyricularia pennisetigena]
MGISSAQPAPHRHTKSWGSSGSRRPDDKEPLAPWHMFATPTFSRSQLEFPKISSSRGEVRRDHTADGLEVGPEATLAALPVSERTSQRSSRAPSDAATTFDLVEKGLDLDGRSFCPLSSPVLDDAAGAVTTTATTTATLAHPNHILQYSQAEPLTPSSYFNASTGGNMNSGGVAGQGLRDQQVGNQQQRYQSVSGRSSVNAPENCLHLLSQLSSKFLMDFGKCGTGDWSTMADDNHSNLSSTIGKLFDGLQIFLKTIERLRPASPFDNFSSGSECSYSDLCDESEFIGLTGDSQMQMHPIGMAVDHVPGGSSAENTHHHHHHHDHHHNSRNRGMNAAEPTDGAAPQPLDMPTTLTILTCYTWLLKGYELVLSGIHELLSSQDRLQGLQSLPAIVHGVRIGGFGMDDHPDMQIEVVIHVGWQLMQRIEGVLGVQVVSEMGKGGLGGSHRDEPSSRGADGGGGGGGAGSSSSSSDERRILDPKSAAAVLDSWFTNATSRGGSGGNGADEDFGDLRGGRRVEIIRTITNIRKFLRSYWRDYNGKTQA